MADIHFSGIVRIRDLPDPAWTPEQFAYWWCDEVASGRRIRAARMSPREKDRYTIYESHNQVMALGITQILTFIGNFSGGTVAFAQYLAIGNGSIFTTNANDTALAGEFFRKIPTGYALNGNQVDVTTVLLASDALGNWTNAALFGNGATGATGSGTMMTHVLTSFSKTAIARTFDYLITAQ